jgi:hypothetical protein
LNSEAVAGRGIGKKEIAMPFVSHPGLPGKVFVPVFNPERSRKHPCRDCFSCQLCGEDRCQVCRGEAEKDDESSNEGDRCVNQ